MSKKNTKTTAKKTSSETTPDLKTQLAQRIKTVTTSLPLNTKIVILNEKGSPFYAGQWGDWSKGWKGEAEILGQIERALNEGNELKLPTGHIVKLEASHVQTVQVMSKAFAEKVDGLKEHGEAIIKKTGELGQLYLSMVMYIRNNSIHLTDKVVSKELAALGFHRQRITEIKRVAGAKAELFHQYEARLLGFNKVLELARKEDKPLAEGLPKVEPYLVPTPAASLLLKSGGIESEEQGNEILEALKPSIMGENGTGGRTKKPADDRISVAMDVIFAALKELGKLPKIAIMTDGVFTITLTKNK